MSLSNTNSVPIKTSNQEVIHESPWTRFVSRPWGPKNLPYYCLELFDFVTIIAITPQNELLLVQQERPAVRSITTELPSGLMDQLHEAPEATISRELTEETGWCVNKITHVATTLTDSGRLDNSLHIFFSDDLIAPEKDWTPEQGIAVKKIPMKKVQASIEQGSINNIMHIGAWYLCKEKSLLKKHL
jgi:8-oxo-dGTP pyrophosphatase MutT (NUDIX family)